MEGKMSTRMRVRARAPPAIRPTTSIIVVIGWRIAKTMGFMRRFLRPRYSSACTSAGSRRRSRVVAFMVSPPRSSPSYPPTAEKQRSGSPDRHDTQPAVVGHPGPALVQLRSGRHLDRRQELLPPVRLDGVEDAS